ncbi:MAG: HAMP domain-containing sensor histidine kinase [Peptococcaceae bacterium]|nr:HAMP domain-containing sensor histidine kinase [Peptococcaceae bacterium]
MKLSTKIIAIMTLVTLLTGLIVGSVTLHLMSNSFDEYLSETQKIEIGEWKALYTNYYEDNGNSWDGVQSVIVTYSLEAAYGLRVTRSYYQPVVLIDPDGVVLAHPEQDFIGLTVNQRMIEHGYPIYEEGSDTLIGYLLPAEYFEHQFWILEESYLTNTRQSVVLGVAGTLLISIIVGLIFARNLTKPLNNLIKSVRRITMGSTNEKVVVENDDEIGELALAFNQMSSELTRANDARVQLFADISHELRTPITAIAGTLENKLVKNEACQPEEISALYDEMLRLSGLVNELQNISRIDAGHMAISKTLVDFKSFFQDFFVLVEADAESRNISVKLEFQEDLPYCYADPERLKQVVLNLVSNGLRYTTDGGTLILKAWSDKQDFIFSVSDTGIGMTEEECSHVFERFYRTDRSRARETGGTGLGMAITQGLVEAHGGRIEVQSKKDVGTTFTVYLPLYDAKAEAKEAKLAQKKAAKEGK